LRVIDITIVFFVPIVILRNEGSPQVAPQRFKDKIVIIIAKNGLKSIPTIYFVPTELLKNVIKKM